MRSPAVLLLVVAVVLVVVASTVAVAVFSHGGSYLGKYFTTPDDNNENFIHQGNMPTVVYDPGEVARTRDMPVVTRQTIQFPVTGPFFFRDGGGNNIFDAVTLKKGQRVELQFSGEPARWTVPDAEHTYPPLGPAGGVNIQKTRDGLQDPWRHVMPDRPQAGVCVMMGTGLDYQNEYGFPRVTGRKPDPVFIGETDIVLESPEDGTQIWATRDLRVLPESWDTNHADQNVQWTVTITVYDPWTSKGG